MSSASFKLLKRHIPAPRKWSIKVRVDSQIQAGFEESFSSLDVAKRYDVLKDDGDYNQTYKFRVRDGEGVFCANKLVRE